MQLSIMAFRGSSRTNFCFTLRFLPIFPFFSQTPLPLLPCFHLFYSPSLFYSWFLISNFFIFIVVVTDLVGELIAPFCLVTFLGPPGPSSLSGATLVFLLRQWTHYNGTLKGQENIRAVTIVPDSESVWYTTQDSQRYSGRRLSVTR